MEIKKYKIVVRRTEIIKYLGEQTKEIHTSNAPRVGDSTTYASKIPMIEEVIISVEEIK